MNRVFYVKTLFLFTKISYNRYGEVYVKRIARKSNIRKSKESSGRIF